jgi:hypothetical protein
MKLTSNRHRWHGDNYIDTHDTRIVNGAIRVKKEKVPNPMTLQLL